MTKFEIIVPVEWGREIFDKLCVILSSHTKEWAYARHPIDELSGFEHYHLGGLLKSNNNVKTITSWFKEVDQIEGNSIEKINSHWNTWLCYIQHKTKDAIKEGKSAPVEVGGNADLEGAVLQYELTIKEQGIVDDIMSGNLREYEFYNDIELMKKVIEKGDLLKVKNSFSCYMTNKLIQMTSRDNMRKQMWLFGLAGSGKTEMAKFFCRGQGYKDIDIYITSSGKNPFDDYRGQPCVIVDDIDSDTLTPKAALKLADMWTGSAVSARYNNKIIMADIVIFTSTISPQTWWDKVSEEKVDGNVFQLLRRLNLGSWWIKGDNIEITLYDGQGSKLRDLKKMLPEEIRDKVKCRKQEQTIDDILDMLEDCSIEEPVKVEKLEDYGF